VVALGLFFVYALTMGLVLGVIVLAYVGSIGMSGVVSAFAGAAAIFGGAALYGAVTRRDLTSLSGILFMGLLGLIVVMFLQLFFFADSSTASLIIGILGVVIFTGLTAWDVQRLKSGAMPNINKDSATVLGALALYLDFINLFLFMLRIFGSSR
jgi:FtsH-binding integral membrane protein